MLQNISEAFEILSDESKRELYNQGGKEMVEQGGGRRGRGGGGGGGGKKGKSVSHNLKVTSSRPSSHFHCVVSRERRLSRPSPDSCAHAGCPDRSPWRRCTTVVCASSG